MYLFPLSLYNVCYGEKQSSHIAPELGVFNLSLKHMTLGQLTATFRS